MDLSFKRIGRSIFALGVVIPPLVMWLLVIVGIPNFFLGTLDLVYIVWLFLLCVGRLHDIGKSGWWAAGVLILTPIGLIVLSALPPKMEGNKYLHNATISK